MLWCLLKFNSIFVHKPTLHSHITPLYIWIRIRLESQTFKWVKVCSRYEIRGHLQVLLLGGVLDSTPSTLCDGDATVAICIWYQVLDAKIPYLAKVYEPLDFIG